MLKPWTMLRIEPCEMPEDALLRRYAGAGGYSDCYTTTVPGNISHADFVCAFYTSPLFKVERGILRWILLKPASDADARLLADGVSEVFSAWHVEARSDNQLLLGDFRKRTRSWLMTAQQLDHSSPRARLYFGSAVVPRRAASGATAELGATVHALLGFHKLYSKALLESARMRLIDRAKRG